MSDHPEAERQAVREEIWRRHRSATTKELADRIREARDEVDVYRALKSHEKTPNLEELYRLLRIPEQLLAFIRWLIPW
jgi:hypothetical protein